MLLFGLSNKKSNVYHLQVIEREFDDLCQNFGIQQNIPTNLKSQYESNTPLFNNDSLYEFSEFCSIYTENHLPVEPVITKLEIDNESTAVKLIENT